MQRHQRNTVAAARGVGIADERELLEEPEQRGIGTAILVVRRRRGQRGAGVGAVAGSILGGLKSLYGAVVGGLLVGAGEILVTTFGAEYVGSWVTAYESGIPLLVMVIALMVFPGGLTSVNWRQRVSRREG